MGKSVLFIAIALLLGLTKVGNAQDYAKKEYLVIRVTHALKKNGVVCRFQAEEISQKEHSLFGKIKINEEEALLITSNENKVIVIHTVTDMLNTLSSLGWSLKFVQELKVLNNSFYEYIFEK